MTGGELKDKRWECWDGENKERTKAWRENVAHINLLVDMLTAGLRDTGGHGEWWWSKLLTEAVVRVSSPWFTSLFSLEAIYWTSLWLFSPFTKNQSRQLSPRPFLFCPFTSFDILSVLVTNPCYESTAMSPWNAMEVSFLVIRSRWEVSVCCLCVDVRYISSGESQMFLLQSQTNK